MAADEREMLIAEIREAFADVGRGEGTSLLQGRVLDEYGSPAEQEAARTRDVDTHWWDVGDYRLERLHNALIFLDADGFRYYLPAFMTWTLRHGRKSDVPVGDYAVGELARRDPTRDLELMTEPQCRAVSRFLQFVASHPKDDWADSREAAVALRRHWGRFL